MSIVLKVIFCPVGLISDGVFYFGVNDMLMPSDIIEIAAGALTFMA